METTFILSKAELNNDFLESVKKLFRNKKHLQIAVSVPEDFGLQQAETKKQSKARIEKCVSEMNTKKNIISITEVDLDNLND